MKKDYSYLKKLNADEREIHELLRYIGFLFRKAYPDLAGFIGDLEEMVSRIDDIDTFMKNCSSETLSLMSEFIISEKDNLSYYEWYNELLKELRDLSIFNKIYYK